MKFNWGTGIVLAFAAFISFILYFVYRASADPKAEHDLVTEAYYTRESQYQARMEAAANLAARGSAVRVERNGSGLTLRFPEGILPDGTAGTVEFYRPSDKQFDFQRNLEQGADTLFVPDSRLLHGRWDIRLDWETGGKPYFQEIRITY